MVELDERGEETGDDISVDLLSRCRGAQRQLRPARRESTRKWTHPLKESVDELRLGAVLVVEQVALLAEADEVVLLVPHERCRRSVCEVGIIVICKQ